MMAGWLGRWRAGASAGLVCLLLAACATPSKIAGNGGAAAFDRTGRFAISVNYRDGKQDAVQGGFAWHDTGGELLLDLANPLGSTLARVQVLPGRAVLVRGNGQTEQAPGPDALVEQVLGSPIPVAGLRAWLHGRTGGAAVAAMQKNDAGQLAGFEQSGWRVALSRYDSLGPRLLQLNRSEIGRDISVRLVIDGQ